MQKRSQAPEPLLESLNKAHVSCGTCDTLTSLSSLFFSFLMSLSLALASVTWSANRRQPRGRGPGLIPMLHTHCHAIEWELPVNFKLI